MGAGLIAGFTRQRLPGDGIEVDALVGGSGPPLLLLHGFPQTRLVWAKVAPALASRFTLVIPDLRGCGRSDKPACDKEHQVYSRRALAKDQVATMAALGFDRFAVAGHGRGGRVAYRLALDVPDSVHSLAVLNLVPTLNAFDAIDATAAVRMWHWFFHLEENGFPERMIAAALDTYLEHVLPRQTSSGFVFDTEIREDYVTCFRDPATIHAGCEDYRAAWHVDRLHDQGDLGLRKLAMPLLVLWGERGELARIDPLQIWRSWADDVQGHMLPTGHFIPEEASEAVVAAFVGFFAHDALNSIESD